MKSLVSIALATCWLMLVTTPSHAQKNDPDTPAITGAWARSTGPGATVSGAYMRIISAKPLRLVKAETPLAGIVELHNMTMKDGVMEMKAMDAVEIPANKLVELKPGSMHIMLMQIRQPFKPGNKVPLALTFERAGGKPLVLNLDVVAQETDPRTNQH